jgi:predicted NBD/HSP70 family sugar kinase
VQYEVSIGTPSLSARVGREALASLIAKLIASGQASSKADIGRVTGLARTTIDGGVRSLLDLGAIRVSGLRSVPGRGRPAEVLRLNSEFGIVLVADCGATIARCGIFDLEQRLLGERELQLRIDAGPEVVLETIAACFQDLLLEAGLEQAPRTTVVGLPGPVDYWGGTLVRPPIMPGWDGYPVVAELERQLGGRAILENDVNLRALGESRSNPSTRGPVLYVKVGTGIGVGIVGADGNLLRGADGAAGDVGHIRVPDATEVCTCGSVGCLEAVASIRAVGMALGIDGTSESHLIAEVVNGVRHQDPATLQVVKERAVYIGETVVSLIHFFNPERIVIGGMLATASDDLLAVVRSIVYSRALPLATRNLTVSRPSLGTNSGLAGGLAIGIERALDPESIREQLHALDVRRAPRYMSAKV